MLYSDIKYDIDNWINLYKPKETPFNFLPFLADFVGYDYSNNISISESRIIIANFVEILRNRGTKLSIQQMISTIITARCDKDPYNDEYRKAAEQLFRLEIYFDYDNGTIKIYTPFEIPYLDELLDYVRPIGTYIEIFISDFPDPESDIAVSTIVTHHKHDNYVPEVKFKDGVTVEKDSTYGVDTAEVNLSQIGKVIMPNED